MKSMPDDSTPTQQLLAILPIRSWTKAERASARQQITLYYERKLMALQTALFEAIALNSPNMANSFDIDEYIHSYHKQSQELYSFINHRTHSNESLPYWLRIIDRDEQGEGVWEPNTQLPSKEQLSGEDTHNGQR
jgi:hypothetical protein